LVQKENILVVVGFIFRPFPRRYAVDATGIAIISEHATLIMKIRESIKATFHHGERRCESADLAPDVRVVFVVGGCYEDGLWSALDE